DLAALLLLDGGLAEREAPGAMAHLGAADEPAWFAGPEVIDFQVRCRGCLTFVGKGVCDSGERLVGQGRDRSAMHDRSPGGGKSMRICGEVALEHEGAGADLEQPSSDVGDHA